MYISIKINLGRQCKNGREFQTDKIQKIKIKAKATKFSLKLLIFHRSTCQFYFAVFYNRENLQNSKAPTKTRGQNSFCMQSLAAVLLNDQ